MCVLHVYKLGRVTNIVYDFMIKYKAQFKIFELRNKYF